METVMSNEAVTVLSPGSVYGNYADFAVTVLSPGLGRVASAELGFDKSVLAH